MKFKVGELTFIRKVLKPAEDVVSVTNVHFSIIIVISPLFPVNRVIRML